MVCLFEYGTDLTRAGVFLLKMHFSGNGYSIVTIKSQRKLLLVDETLDQNLISLATWDRDQLDNGEQIILSLCACCSPN